MEVQDISPDSLLNAYRRGLFPMAETHKDIDLFWVDPKYRGILPLNQFHISKSMRRCILREDYTIKVTSAFSEVISACAARPETWINKTIFDLYCTLAEKKQAHSLEVWHDNELIGGVYGVVIGAAFFGESMFSRRKNASKIALAYLVHRLTFTGFKLFDTQFITPHLASLGAIEIPRETYLMHLSKAVDLTADFTDPSYSVSASGIVQRSTQTS